MRRTVAVLALVTALSVTGCSMTSAGPGGADGEAVAASAQPLTKEAAAEQFSQIASAYDGVVSQFESATKSDAPIEEQTGLAMATSAALRAEAEGLRNTVWPEDVAADAKALADAADKAAAHWEKAAEAGSPKEVRKHVKMAEETKAAEAEAAIRKALDLPES